MRRAAPILAAGLLTGLLTILPFPDIGAWPVAPLAMVPLLLAMPSAGAGTAFLSGWIAGAVSLAGIFHWLVPTAINLAGFPGWGAALVLAAYAVAFGLDGAIAAWALRAAMRLPLPAWATVLLAPAVVVASDVALPHLFPFGLGNTYWRVPELIQGAEWTGIEGATFVTVALSAAIALALRDLAVRRMPRPAPIGIATALAAAWIGYGAVRLPAVREAESTAPVLRLLLVQPDVRPDERRSRDPAVRDAIVDRLLQMTRDGMRPGVDAAVWPEGAFPFDWPSPSVPGGPPIAGRAATKVARGIRDLGRPLVFGAITRPDGRARNSMVLLGADGIEAGRYDKRRLLAFGEYLPLSDTFPSLKGRIPGVGNLKEGDTFGSFRVGGAVAAPSICYEAVHADLTREAVEAADASVILNLTNDGWFGTSGAPSQHLMVQVPRAVELRRPLVRSTMTGISAVVHASGDLSGETGVYERTAEVVEVPVPASGRTPFAAGGRWFAGTCIAASLAIVAAFVALQRRGKKSRSTSTG